MATAMTTDAATAALEDKRAAIEALPATLGSAGCDWDSATAAAGHATSAGRSLLAAVEAVLKLADEAHVMLADREYWHEPSEPVAWDLDPAKVREAITRELTGKEAGDAAERDR
jgi:hypothetical protein